jgi:CheY-like chemotaxis protein
LETQNANDNNSKELPHINLVMVVDDDDNWCFVTRMLLQEHGIGKQIVAAHNGLEALKKLQANAAAGEKQPELIFLDIKMPVMDGFELLEQLAKHPELNLGDTKIYLTTSSFLAKDKERAKLYQIAGFITKPLSEDILKDILSTF